MTKKIVVTGIGTSSPLGGTAPESWAALLAGESGVRSLSHEWVAQYALPVTFAAEAKVRPCDVLTRQETKRLDPSSQFALISAREAWADAGEPEVAPERLGVDYATGIGGLWSLLDAWDTLREKRPASSPSDDGTNAHAERRLRRDLDGPRGASICAHGRVGLRIKHRVDL